MALWLAGTIVVGAVYVWSRPAVGTATYQYQGRAAHRVALPFFVPTEGDRLDVSFTMVLAPIRAGTFRVKPDDCIDQLVINGHVVDGHLANFCDYAAGPSLDLSPYLRTGPNEFHVTLRDHGGLGGLRIEVSAIDPLFLVLCAAFVACAGRLTLAVGAFASHDTVDRSLLAIAAGGAVLRFLYVLATHYSVRGHDTDAHIEYIRYVAAHLRVPPAAGGWEFHQPPLYYFVTGLYLRWASSIGVSLESILVTIQVLSLLLCIASFVAALWIGTMLFDSRRERARLLLYAAIVATAPASVYTAARISNDALYQWLSFLSFGLLLSWWKRGDTRTWYLLVVTVSLAISTKTSGVVFLPVVFACLFLRDRRSWRSQMTPAALALGIVLLVAGTVPIMRIMRDPGAHRLWTMGNESMNGALALDTKARSFLTFNPIAIIDKPENNPWVNGERRQYFWEYFFRSAFFGEFTFAPSLRFLERVIVATGLLALPLAAVGLVSEARHRLHRSLPLLLTCGLLLASVVSYRVRFPYAPDQDFRFVTLLSVPLTFTAVQGAFVLPPAARQAGVLILTSQAGLCALFLVLLLFITG